MKLLSKGAKNHKIGKNKEIDLILYSLNLRPHKTEIAGKIKNVCPYANSCAKLCVGDNGHFSMKNGSAYKAQLRKTKEYFTDTNKFYQDLYNDINNANNYGLRNGKQIAMRLNAYSDINHAKQSKRYLGESIYNLFPQVIFYDYTKDYKKAIENSYPNYFLTFSRDETTNKNQIDTLLSMKKNVSVVFEEIPQNYLGYPVHNGDQDDNRFLDPKGQIIGLKFKGSKKKLLHSIASGFTVSNFELLAIALQKYQLQN